MNYLSVLPVHTPTVRSTTSGNCPLSQQHKTQLPINDSIEGFLNNPLSIKLPQLKLLFKACNNFYPTCKKCRPSRLYEDYFLSIVYLYNYSTYQYHRSYAAWGNDRKEMVTIKLSRISCRKFSVFMNNSQHGESTKIPWPRWLDWWRPESPDQWESIFVLSEHLRRLSENDDENDVFDEIFQISPLSIPSAFRFFVFCFLSCISHQTECLSTPAFGICPRSVKQLPADTPAYGTCA